MPPGALEVLEAAGISLEIEFEPPALELRVFSGELFDEAEELESLSVCKCDS